MVDSPYQLVFSPDLPPAPGLIIFAPLGMGSICGRSHGFAELYHDPYQPPLKMLVSNRNSADGHTVDKKEIRLHQLKWYEIFSIMG